VDLRTNDGMSEKRRVCEREHETGRDETWLERREDKESVLVDYTMERAPALPATEG